jgi:hypothetical protein
MALKVLTGKRFAKDVSCYMPTEGRKDNTGCTKKTDCNVAKTTMHRAICYWTLPSKQFQRDQIYSLHSSNRRKIGKNVFSDTIQFWNQVLLDMNVGAKSATFRFQLKLGEHEREKLSQFSGIVEERVCLSTEAPFLSAHSLLSSLCEQRKCHARFASV